MTSVRWSVVVVVLVTACEFRSPGAVPTEPRIDAATDDAAADATDAASPAPWLHPWARRKSITLRASQIEAPGGGALTDFPVLVSIADPEIRAAALLTGEDIVFTAGDATTLLASEIEAFTPSTSDQLIAWVKVPSLPATTDTTLYVYYGNPSPPLQTPEEVWTANYLAVWHLHQDPGSGGNGEIRDATSGNHDGTAAAPMESDDSVQGRIGRGLRFNGTDEFLSFGSMNVGNTFTISMWVEFAGGSNIKSLMATSGSGREADGFRFFVNTVNLQDRRLIFETGNGTVGEIAETNVNAIGVNVLAHVAAVVDRAAATALIFVNGTSVATDTSIRNDFRTNSDFEVSRMENGIFHFPGILDEIQVSNTLRAPEWLQTSFNNQAQPGTFLMLGPEEPRP